MHLIHIMSRSGARGEARTVARTSVKARFRALIPLALTMAMVMCIVGSASAELIEIPGTGACEVVLRRLAAVFNEQSTGHKVEVPPSTGSNGGIRSVMEGKAVLARVARPLKADEFASGLRYKPFGRDPVLFVVGRGVTIRNLTTAQIVDVFSGKVLNWRDIGGQNAPIRVLTREPDDSSLMVIRQHIGAFEGIVFSPSSKCLYHDYEMLDALTKYRNSVGWLTGTSHMSAKKSVTALALDGTSATVGNVHAGRYKLVEQYAFVYKPGALTGAARSFLRFLFSNEGKERMTQLGLIPSDEGWSDEDA